jgi:hypothetical protein
MLLLGGRGGTILFEESTAEDGEQVPQPMERGRISVGRHRALSDRMVEGVTQDGQPWAGPTDDATLRPAACSWRSDRLTWAQLAPR